MSHEERMVVLRQLLEEGTIDAAEYADAVVRLKGVAAASSDANQTTEASPSTWQLPISAPSADTYESQLYAAAFTAEQPLDFETLRARGGQLIAKLARPAANSLVAAGLLVMHSDRYAVPHGAPAPDLKAPDVSTSEGRIYAELSFYTPYTVFHLARESGLTELAVVDRLQGLIARGLAVEVGPGRYRRAPDAPSLRTGPRGSMSGVGGRPSRSTRRQPARVGGWAWAVVLLTWLGGLIGYLSLKDADPVRANHVLKWGLIWTAINAVFAVMLIVLGT